MALPRTSAGVNVRDFHPVFEERLVAFFADPDIEGNVEILSGCRSPERQAELYAGWVKRLPGYNLAADPKQRFGAEGQWVGSWHMRQADGYCYAVDLRRKRNKLGLYRIGWEKLRAVAYRYGLRPTVTGEPWHYQHRNASVVFGAEELNGVRPWPRRPSNTPTLKKRLPGLGAVNSSDHVKWLQKEILLVKPDGAFGPITHSKVEDLQSIWGLTVDGIVGPQTWQLLDSLGAPR